VGHKIVSTVPFL